MIFYTTEWKKGEKKGRYKTKTLTEFHHKIHEMCDYAQTVRYDTSISWPFGLHGEIIKKSKK